MFVPAGHYFVGTTALDIMHTLIIEGDGTGMAVVAYPTKLMGRRGRPGSASSATHLNESLQTLDLAAFAAVEQPPLNDPPPSPLAGSCYIVGDSRTGEWTGLAHGLAGYTSGGWRAVPAMDGMTVYVKSESKCACFRSGAWEIGIVRGSSLAIEGVQVVGAQAAAINSASGGATVDAEARTAIDQILTALRQHGLIAS